MGADCRARGPVTPVLTQWPQPHSSARGIPLPHGPDLGVSPAPVQPCVHRWVLVCAHTAGMRMCVCARAPACEYFCSSLCRRCLVRAPRAASGSHSPVGVCTCEGSCACAQVCKDPCEHV